LIRQALSEYFVGVETQNSAKQTALNTQAVEIAGYQELIANNFRFTSGPSANIAGNGQS
jgi:hypothetical protein